MKFVLSVSFCASLAFLAACTTETLRHEGVTAYAGDAIAANTALQMVDPWPYGSQETDLKTPAVRVTAAAAAAAPAATNP